MIINAKGIIHLQTIWGTMRDRGGGHQRTEASQCCGSACRAIGKNGLASPEPLNKSTMVNYAEES
jgi:hypothetical protein